MRSTFIAMLWIAITMAIGCSQSEKAEEPNPDPRVSDPYLGSALDANQTKSKQDSKK